MAKNIILSELEKDELQSHKSTINGSEKEDQAIIRINGVPIDPNGNKFRKT